MNEQQIAMRKLVDEDGENRAVRMFLAAMMPGMTLGSMRKHLTMSGYPFWPKFVDETPEGSHLTKGGAQLWLRHLFSLEQQPASPLSTFVRSSDEAKAEVMERVIDKAIEEQQKVLEKQPADEPVAWRYKQKFLKPHHNEWYYSETNPEKYAITVESLYTRHQPAAREPLTDDELTDLWTFQSLDWMEFARAIEAAHGITAPQQKDTP